MDAGKMEIFGTIESCWVWLSLAEGKIALSENCNKWKFRLSKNCTNAKINHAKQESCKLKVHYTESSWVKLSQAESSWFELNQSELNWVKLNQAKPSWTRLSWEQVCVRYIGKNNAHCVNLFNKTQFSAPWTKVESWDTYLHMSK